MAVELIIFDLDGTLVDSLDDLTDAVNVMRARFGAPPVSRVEVRSMVGQGARTLVERALPGLSAEDTDRALDLFLAYNEAHIADRTRAYDGIPELLSTIHRNGIPMVVVSNKHTALCRRLLETLGLAGYFDAIYGADAFAERKPSPLPFMEVMRSFRVSPTSTVVVGDSSNDVIPARMAGLRMIGCAYGYAAEGELASLPLVAASSLDLLPMLDPQANL